MKWFNTIPHPTQGFLGLRIYGVIALAAIVAGTSGIGITSTINTLSNTVEAIAATRRKLTS